MGENGAPPIVECVEIIVVDETVANMTKGEPEGAFEDAFAKLKTALGEQLDKQGLK